MVDESPRASKKSQPGSRAGNLGAFREFSEAAFRFSRSVAPGSPGPGIADSAELNLQIAKTVFGKWSLEIMVLLYSIKQLGFEQIRRTLEGISRRVLSEKLKQLETRGLIRRSVISAGPQRVSYSLTEKGLIVARLGEPVFLFLRSEERADSD